MKVHLGSILVACLMLLWAPESASTNQLPEDVRATQHRHRREGEVILDTSLFLKDAPYFELPVQNVTAQVGHTAKLTCVVENLGHYKVAWGYKETGAVLTVATQVITNNRDVSVQREQRSTWVLTITNITSKDQGGYWCQVNTSPPTSTMGYLNVVEPPVLEESVGEVIVDSGASTDLTCRAHGTPHPTIRWIREDGHPIRLTPYLHVGEVVGEMLVLRGVNQSSAGGYFCIASNGHPPSDSRRVKVTVNYAPVVKGPQATVWAVAGSTVSLSCLLAAHPTPRVAWRRHNTQGTQILGKDYFTLTPQDGHPPFTLNMTLKMRNLMRSDFGLYTCSVGNYMGQAEATTVLRELVTTTSTSTTTTTTSTPPSATTAVLPPPRLVYGDYDDSAKNLTSPLVFNSFPDMAKGVRQENSSSAPTSSSSFWPLTRLLQQLLALALLQSGLSPTHPHHTFVSLVFAVIWLYTTS